MTTLLCIIHQTKKQRLTTNNSEKNEVHVEQRNDKQRVVESQRFVHAIQRH